MKKSLLIIAFILILSTGLIAQTLRIAYVDMYRIISESNDTREAERIFQIDRDNWIRQINEMEEEILRLERELETRRLTLTESGRREAEERILARIRERQQFIERVYGEDGLASTRNDELMEPILEKLRIAIDKIAVQEDYSIIFDSSTGVVWAQDRLDITPLVIEEMNR